MDLIANKSELTEQVWEQLNITDLEPTDYVQVRGPLLHSSERACKTSTMTNCQHAVL